MSEDLTTTYHELELGPQFRSYVDLSASEIESEINEIKERLKVIAKQIEQIRSDDSDDDCKADLYFEQSQLLEKLTCLTDLLEVRLYYKVTRDGIKKRVNALLRNGFDVSFGVNDIVQTLLDDGRFWDLIIGLKAVLGQECLSQLTIDNVETINDVAGISNLIDSLKFVLHELNRVTWNNPRLQNPNLATRLEFYTGELERYINRVARHFLKNFNFDLLEKAIKTRKKFERTNDSDYAVFSYNDTDKSTGIKLIYRYSVETDSETIEFYIPQIDRTVNAESLK